MRQGYLCIDLFRCGGRDFICHVICRPSLYRYIQSPTLVLSIHIFVILFVATVYPYFESYHLWRGCLEKHRGHVLLLAWLVPQVLGGVNNAVKRISHALHMHCYPLWRKAFCVCRLSVSVPNLSTLSLFS